MTDHEWVRDLLRAYGDEVADEPVPVITGPWDRTDEQDVDHEYEAAR